MALGSPTTAPEFSRRHWFITGRNHLSNNAPQPKDATWDQGVRELPDLLVAAQLSLRSLAKGETAATSVEGRRIVGDACDLLRDALANFVEITRNSPEFPLQGVNGMNRQASRDPRMTPRSDDDLDGSSPPTEQCALTQRIGGPVRSFPHVMTRLTSDQLDRLRRCANGNTLRFESSDIVEALVAGGYATEGAGRVVTVTSKGHRYLLSHPA